jgi:hypothetical protein
VSEGRSPEFLSFLTDLQKRDQQSADRLFLDALGIVRLGSSDPNDVLFLGLYLFTPGQVSFTDLDGQLIIGTGINFGAVSKLPDTLLQPYLATAAEVLERAAVSPNTPRSLLQFALQRMLPLFEKHMPGAAGWMRTFLAQLGPLPAALNQEAIAHDRKTTPSAGDKPPVSEVVKEIERTPGSARRDELYFQAGDSSLKRDDFESARDLFSRVSDLELRNQLFEFVSFREAMKALRQNKPDVAENIATLRLDHDRSALIHSLVASELFKQGFAERALSLVNDALTKAGKTDDAGLRASSYVYLARPLVEKDVHRAFEVTGWALKSMEQVASFDLNNARVTFRFRRPGGGTFERGISAGPGLLSLISKLARIDLDRVITMSRSTGSPERRASIVIGAARGVLSGS